MSFEEVISVFILILFFAPILLMPFCKTMPQYTELCVEEENDVFMKPVSEDHPEEVEIGTNFLEKFHEDVNYIKRRYSLIDFSKTKQDEHTIRYICTSRIVGEQYVNDVCRDLQEVYDMHGIDLTVEIQIDDVDNSQITRFISRSGETYYNNL